VRRQATARDVSRAKTYWRYLRFCSVRSNGAVAADACRATQSSTERVEVHPTSNIASLAAKVPPSLREALFLFLVFRIGLSLLAVAAAFMFGVPPPCFHHGVVDWVTMPELHAVGPEGMLFGVWERWDACWYLRIATFGYPPAEPGTAFFPAYPVAVRIGGAFLGDLTLGALFVSALGYIAAMAVLHSMVRRDFSAAVANRAVLYASAFPTAFFFFAPFTESTFLALAISAIYFARSGRFAFAAALGLLAGLTRAQGALLALPLAWQALTLLRPPESERVRWRRVAAGSAAAIAPVVGFLSFLAVSSSLLGASPLGAAQQHWGYAMAPPWEVLSGAWKWMMDDANAVYANIRALTAFHLVLIAMFVAGFVVGLRRLPAVYSIYWGPQLFLITAGGPATPLASASRYMLVMFPMFVVLALAGKGRWLHTGWLAASLLGLALLTLAFLQNVPVG